MARLTAVLGSEPRQLEALHGGCVGEVYRVDMAGGQRFAAKVASGQAATLDLEAYMLRLLEPHLPVPQVVHAAADLLVMEWVPGDSRYSKAAQVHAAELLAGLHGVQQTESGLERDTLIGGLYQPNAQTSSWVDFFAQQRLLYMGCQAHEHGLLPAGLLRKVERLAERLSLWIEEPAMVSLLHGDVWSGNVLASGSRIQAFLDPAVYFGHAEVELAFISMFGTFGEDFFAAYQDLRPIAEGFFEERRHLYNLYPYLVHLRLFGQAYLPAVKSILDRFAG